MDASSNRVSHRTKILTGTGVLDDKWTPLTHITMTGWWHWDMGSCKQMEANQVGTNRQTEGKVVGGAFWDSQRTLDLFPDTRWVAFTKLLVQMSLENSAQFSSSLPYKR